MVYLVCLFTYLILLTGCPINDIQQSNHDASNNETPSDDFKSVYLDINNGKHPDVLKITRCLYFGDSGENAHLKKDFMEVFSNKTGINLEINYPPRSNYMEKVNLMITSGELDGMVNYFTAYDIIMAIENDLIEPMDEYLKDNETWNSLPDDYKNKYKINGKIYAISAGYNNSYFTRSFRKDWLDNLGLNIPETVDELFEVAKAFTEDDPDRNGKNDTVALTSSWFWNLQDIFQAFDVILDNTGDGPISWDPVTGVWQDSMLKPQMADALSFIKKLYDLGYLDNDLFTNEGSNMRGNLLSGKAGSAFYWAMYGYKEANSEMKSTAPEAEWVEVPAIKGKRTEMLNCLASGGLIYVLVKDTPQPNETVNTFVDMLFGVDTYLMLRYGIEGKTFELHNNNIIIKSDPNSNMPYATSGLTEDMTAFSKFNYPVIVESSEDLHTTLRLLEVEKTMRQKAIDEGLFFSEKGFQYNIPISEQYMQHSDEYSRIFREETAMAILGEKPIQQALDDYRKKMKALGADKVLEEANAFIGKDPNQTY